MQSEFSHTKPSPSLSMISQQFQAQQREWQAIQQLFQQLDSSMRWSISPETLRCFNDTVESANWQVGTRDLLSSLSWVRS